MLSLKLPSLQCVGDTLTKQLAFMNQRKHVLSVLAPFSSSRRSITKQGGGWALAEGCFPREGEGKVYVYTGTCRIFECTVYIAPSGSIRPVLSHPGQFVFRIIGACASGKVSNVRIFFLPSGGIYPGCKDPFSFSLSTALERIRRRKTRKSPQGKESPSNI